MAPKILEVRQLTKRFPGVLALDRVEFDLEEGEVHSLCGENGAGKSTLIKCLSGIWPAQSYEGEIAVAGQPTAFANVAESEAAGVGVMYHELALIREMSVAENIFLGNEPTNALGMIDWNQVYSGAAELLKRFNLDLDPTARVGDLGVGHQQMVEIVKALAKDTKILLLDEPTAALTETEVDILLDIVKGLKKRKITCVYISHKLDEVFAISDRITVLRDGASIVTLDAKKSDKNEVIRNMVGRDIEDLFPRQASPLGEVLLKVENLNVKSTIEESMILKDISFELRKGEVLGFGGLMGAGRTELLMHIYASFGARVSGRVTLKGEELKGNTPRESIKKGLSLVSEDRKRYGLVLEQQIGFNQSLSSLDDFTHYGCIDSNAEVVTNWDFFKTLRIKAPGLESRVGGLSGGNQQKVVIAKALMIQPDIIFLDEPTRGIDVGAKLEVYQLMNRLTEEGKAVVLVSSELPELMGMSDRMIMLSEGRIGGEFTRDQATQQALLEAMMAHC